MSVELQPVVDQRHVKAKLARVFGLELARLQLDHDVPQLGDVEEQQVQLEVVPVDVEMHLPSDEGEAAAELTEGVHDPIH